MAEFLERERTLENYWRAVILFGQNVASYKFALAKTLIELSTHDNDSIKLEALAEPFSRHIVEHLAKAPKQATSSSSRFLSPAESSQKVNLPRTNSSGRRPNWDSTTSSMHFTLSTEARSPSGSSWMTGRAAVEFD